MPNRLSTSWVHVATGSDFPLQNLPLGIFSTSSHGPRAGVALGEQVIDLSVLQAAGFLSELGLPAGIFTHSTLNPFFSLGKKALRTLRKKLLLLFDENEPSLQDQDQLHAQLLIPQQAITLHLPVAVGDYTDFYSSLSHATNIGTLFRGPQAPLPANWHHMPIGYHGRASSIVPSGTAVRRPVGQRKPPHGTHPVFGPSTQLDFELEVACISCGHTQLGTRISVTEAEEYIAGVVLFNDWSARDIQAWEYVPLGPFLGKSFASSVSPWVVTLEALAPFRVAGPVQSPAPLPYLQNNGLHHFDVHLEAHLRIPSRKPHCISRTNLKHVYWSMQQQLTHQTVGGCNLRAGDMYASGTISGPSPDSYGSMLELSWKGERPLVLPNKETRSFLLDGDQLTLRGYAEKNGLRIGFGEVSGDIQPAHST